ncbi:MAG: DUF4442 domain-containing protein [Hahellaceae bacterium]|nr:DUF4442 domain-containing protein [Hahellaceae bacterium]MCP5169106.1 DUF4442 domain-containing protein [Hahellaceae bacterium]
MKNTPKLLKRLLNVYPPYFGAGIKIHDISPDWRRLKVSMSLRWYNRNSVNTHFGGSLYSMIDPHLMLLLLEVLGKGYIVWDQSAEITFVKATKKRVTADIMLTESDIERIKAHTEAGDKYLPTFTIDIRSDDGELVAQVRKVLYVRKKSEMRAAA